MKSTTIPTGKAKHVVLPVKYEAIKSTVRQGDNLVITLHDGQVIVLEGFYLEPRTLLVNGSEGNLVQQLVLSEEGAVVSAETLSAAQLDALLGAQAANLPMHYSLVRAVLHFLRLPYRY